MQSQMSSKGETDHITYGRRMYILWDPEREAVCSDIDVVVVGKQVIFVLDSY